MKRRIVLTAIVLGLFAQAENSSASAFRVTPVRVMLERNSASALLTLSNESSDTLRFQVSAFAWSQDANGTMKLTKTEDITFFPALVTLKPGEERKVRVGARTVPGATEKSYRMFFEELPPLVTSAATEGAQVRILTKMGVPVFFAPEKTVEKAVVASGRVEGGTLRFDVRNEGSVRFAVQGVNVRGVGAGEETLFERQLDGWYVLAGTARSYELAIPTDVCPKLRGIIIDAQTDSLAEEAAKTTARLDVVQSACR